MGFPVKKEILIAVNALSQTVRYFSPDEDLYFHENSLFSWYRFVSNNPHLSFYRVTYLPLEQKWKNKPINIDEIIEHPSANLEPFNIRFVLEDFERASV